MSWSLRPPPSTPPPSLTSAKATSTPSRTLCPSSERPPENGPLMPTFTGSCAFAGSAVIAIAAAASTALQPSNFPIMLPLPLTILVFRHSSLELQADGFAVPQGRAILLGPGLKLVFFDLFAGGLGQRVDE